MMESGGMDRFGELSGEFDVAIIGGGIVGAGIARDAALRGLRVALFEKNDFGSGTTSGSTRLIHGGLRYLEMFDFGLVRMDLRERETLLRIAPHLVKPLEFIVPFYSRSLFYRAKLRAGMVLYDVLSYDKTLPNHHFLNAADTLAAEPQLLPEGLQGAAVYHDAQVRSPERLCLENIIEAREFGAVTLNYAEVIGAVNGLRVRDTLNDAETEVRAKVVVNASGPWFDRVAAKIEAAPPRRVRTTKGIHVACEPVSSKAVVLYSKTDGRLFFVIPLLGFSWIGTTDTDFSDDPGTAHATAQDVEYLMQSASGFFPALETKDIFWSNAGVRALVREKGSESSVSRAHHVVDSDGLISVIGGKITGYRAIAEEVTDLVCKKLGVNKPCQTADLPLPGARGAEPGLGDSDDSLHDLRSLYGDRMHDVLRLAGSDARLLQPLAPQYPDIAAQVVFAVRQEQCLQLADFMRRRSLLGLSRDQGLKAVPTVASLMAAELGWSVSHTASQVDDYERWAADSRRFTPIESLNS